MNIMNVMSLSAKDLLNMIETVSHIFIFEDQCQRTNDQIGVAQLPMFLNI